MVNAAAKAAAMDPEAAGRCGRVTMMMAGGCGPTQRASLISRTARATFWLMVTGTALLCTQFASAPE